MGRLWGVLTVINIVRCVGGGGSRTALTGLFAVEFVVGFYDTLDELMADDVLFLEFDFADSFYAFQDLHGLYESGGGCRRQVDLCHIASNDHFGIHSEAGEEHLDLVCRRVLRFFDSNQCYRLRNSVIEYGLCRTPHRNRNELFINVRLGIWIRLVYLFEYFDV